MSLAGFHSVSHVSEWYWTASIPRDQSQPVSQKKRPLASSGTAVFAHKLCASRHLHSWGCLAARAVVPSSLGGALFN